MSVPFLLIDGYNLLHAAGLARVRYGPGDMERARHRLLGMLCEKLTIAEQMRCTVVFDAQQAPVDTVRESKHHELRVLFAPPGTDADSTIEDLIARHSAARQTIIVSGDHRLHKAARRRGATAMDSEPFWERLLTRQDARTFAAEPAGSPAKPREQPTTKETENWLKEFGEVSVEELAAEVRAESQSVPGGTPWERHLSELEETLANPQSRAGFVDDPQRHKRRR